MLRSSSSSSGTLLRHRIQSVGLSSVSSSSLLFGRRRYCSSSSSSSNGNNRTILRWIGRQQPQPQQLQAQAQQSQQQQQRWLSVAGLKKQPQQLQQVVQQERILGVSQQQQQQQQPHAIFALYNRTKMNNRMVGALRPFSSSSSSSSSTNSKKTDSPSSGGDNNNNSNDNNDTDTTKEIVLTPGEKVVAAGRLTMWSGILGLAVVCAYFIGKELIPTKMSPNRVFDRAFEVVKTNPQIQRRYGETLKAYGKDHGGHREGRRNFVENTQYRDKDDGSKRTRVRFNLEGPHGSAFVFAEVSSDMPSGEFVYVLVQDKSNGRVQTLIDNRAALTAARLSGGNTEGLAAMNQLLGGGKKN